MQELAHQREKAEKRISLKKVVYNTKGKFMRTELRVLKDRAE